MMLVFILVMVGFTVVRSLVRDWFHFLVVGHKQIMVMCAGYARQNHQIARPKD